VPPARPRHTLLFSLLIIVLAAGAVFATVALNALAAGDAVRSQQLEDQLVAAQREHSRLIIEVAELEDPGRIRDVATTQLGMVPAREPGFLTPERALPADGLPADEVALGAQTDPLKPVLSQGG